MHWPTVPEHPTVVGKKQICPALHSCVVVHGDGASSSASSVLASAAPIGTPPPGSSGSSNCESLIGAGMVSLLHAKPTARPIGASRAKEKRGSRSTGRGVYYGLSGPFRR